MTNTWSFNEVIKPVINHRKRDPSNCEDWTYRRGDIYLADLNPYLVLVACVGDSVDNKALKRIDRLFYETL